MTHASRVIAVVRCNEAESLISTHAFVPLNTSAWPYLPAVVHVAFAMVPVFPVLDASETVVPVPSLNEYAATRPGVPFLITVTSVLVLLAVLRSPPPLTIAELVTLAGASLATFTVSVIAG